MRTIFTIWFGLLMLFLGFVLGFTAKHPQPQFDAVASSTVITNVVGSTPIGLETIDQLEFGCSAHPSFRKPYMATIRYGTLTIICNEAPIPR